MKLTILYAKNKTTEQLQEGWGISFCLNETVLFDTGESAKALFGNMQQLQIDPQKLTAIVISHTKWDHLGGVWDLLAHNKKVSLYITPDFFSRYKQKLHEYSYRICTEKVEVAKNIFTSGSIPSNLENPQLFEQALIVRTAKGLSLITGCARPGILKFLERGVQLFYQDKWFAVLGGFHLMESEKRFVRYIAEQLRKNGVQWVGPCHCSGYESITIFEEVFPGHVLDIAVGTTIEL